MRQCLVVEKLKGRKAEPRTRPAMCVADSASMRGTALPPHVAHVATNPVRRVRTHDVGMQRTMEVLQGGLVGREAGLQLEVGRIAVEVGAARCTWGILGILG